jgi:hypothetical protein
MMSSWYAFQAKYSTLVTSEVFGKTSGGRDMVAFLIGNKSAPGRFMLDGACHDFETLGSEISYYYIKWLLQKRVPTYASLLSKILIIVVPIVNVDEYAIAKKDINGVDLNRNFDWHWSWTATTGGGVSSNPSSPNYRGPYPLSESEDRAMKRLWAKYKPKNYINFHQGGSPIIWHADTKYNTNTAQRLADNSYFSQTIAKYRQLALVRGVSSYSVYVDGGTGNFGNSPYYYDHTYSWSCELWAWPIPTYSKVPTILGDWLPLLLTLCQQSV